MGWWPAVSCRLLDFQSYWESTTKPFEWKVTRQDLAKLLAKLGNKAPALRQQNTKPYL